MDKIYDEVNMIPCHAKDESPNPRETPLDEVATKSLWDKAEPRYWVHLTVDNFREYNGVDIVLLHPLDTIPLSEIAPLVVLNPGCTIEDVDKWYTRSAIEQTFSKAEVRQLHAYFKNEPDVRRFDVKRAKAPDNQSAGWIATPCGRGQGFYEFYRDSSYSLPFQVEGYYDVRELNRDAALTQRKKALEILLNYRNEHQRDMSPDELDAFDMVLRDLRLELTFEGYWSKA